MFIANRALSRRMILRGMGATLALPFLDAMVPVFRPAAAATPVRRFGAVFVPLGERPGFWDADDRGRQLRVERHHEAARGVPQPHDRGLTAVRPARRSRDDGRGLAERRDPEADAGRERPQRRDRRSGDRRSDRAGHADAVARAGDRGLHRVDRRLRPVVQLRLHEHHLVEERDHADADGDQPAQRVRADVRPPGHERPAPRADGHRPEHARLAARGAQGAAARVSAGRTELASTTTWRTCGRSSSGFRRRRSSRSPTWRSRTRRLAYRSSSRITPR